MCNRNSNYSCLFYVFCICNSGLFVDCAIVFIAKWSSDVAKNKYVVMHVGDDIRARVPLVFWEAGGRVGGRAKRYRYRAGWVGDE